MYTLNKQRICAFLQVSDKPLVYLMDTPGIMFPRVKRPEMGLKLALTGAISEKIVEETLLVEYMLHCIHKAKIQRFYMQELKMKKSASNIEEVSVLSDRMSPSMMACARISQRYGLIRTPLFIPGAVAGKSSSSEWRLW